MPRLGSVRELASLLAAADYCEKQGLPLHKELRTLHGKLTKPKTAAPGANVAGIERELVAASNGIVLAATGGPAYWAIQSRKYAEMSATPEDAALVGKWMATQAWMASRHYTIDSLARFWVNYLANARAMTTDKKGKADGWTRAEVE